MKRYLVALLVAFMLISCSSLSLGRDFSSLGGIRTPESEASQEKAGGVIWGVVPALGQEESADTVEVAQETTMDEPMDEGVEFTPIGTEEAVEAILGAKEETVGTAPEEVTDVLPEIELKAPVMEDLKKDLEAKSIMDKMKEGTVPDAILWTFSVMFLATLFTLCYIAKQRKEATWHKFRD